MNEVRPRVGCMHLRRVVPNRRFVASYRSHLQYEYEYNMYKGQHSQQSSGSTNFRVNVVSINSKFMSYSLPEYNSRILSQYDF